MSDDLELRKSILDELQWEPGVRAAGVGVVVEDGVATLEGRVESLAEKWAAERAAKRVSGLKALAVRVEVLPPGPSERTDADIARAAENALEWNVWVPWDQIKVTVENGWITLEGEVDFELQRSSAEEAVQRLRGVRGVSNEIGVKPRVTPSDIRTQIEAAFRRNALLEAEHITVKSDGTSVTLTGNVGNWAERDEAERAASAAPGVTRVNNFITVTD